jgi:hypothetical protein
MTMPGRGSDLPERDLSDFEGDLRRRARLGAPPALRAELRAALLGAPASPARRPSIWSRLSLRPAAALALVVAVLVAGAGSAAAASLPGDPAFGLKRVTEDLQVALASDDPARLDLLVMLSDRRLSELSTVAAARPNTTGAASDEYQAAVARVTSMLAVLLGEPETPERDAAIANASAASADHIAELEALLGRLPPAAQPGLQRAIDAQQNVHGKSGDAPGHSAPPGGAPGRPSTVPGSTGHGGPPSRSPGRP